MHSQTLCWLAVAVLAAAGRCAADTKADFDDLWSDTFGHIVTDTEELAKAMWNNACDDCDYSNPSVQRNNTEDPGSVFNFQDSSDSNPFYEIATHAENLIRNYYYSPLLDDFPADPDSNSPYPNEVFATIMKTLFGDASTDFGDFLSDLNDHTGLANVKATGGAGMGWGLSMFCDQELLLAYGGGLGYGFDGTQQAVTGGAGGGAGFQAYLTGTGPAHDDDDYSQSRTSGPYDDDPSTGLFYNIGGGGGGGVRCTSEGCVNPTWGTNSDPGELTPQGLWGNVSARASACYKAGSLILVGGGGAGGGWTAVDDMGQVVGNYGGGFGFSFEMSSPTGGVTPPSNNKGSQIGAAVNQCLSKCSNLRSSGSGFYACLCPCTKQAFLSLGETWANSISCST